MSKSDSRKKADDLATAVFETEVVLELRSWIKGERKQGFYRTP